MPETVRLDDGKIMAKVWSKLGRRPFEDLSPEHRVSRRRNDSTPQPRRNEMNQAPALFSTVPRTDPFLLFPDGKPNGQHITDLLHLKKKDVARATKLSEKSVRYDLRMPELLESWLREVATTATLVAEFFSADPAKTWLWFSTPNPQLGNMTPVDLIKIGRVRKLLAFVQTALDENKR